MSKRRFRATFTTAAALLIVFDLVNTAHGHGNPMHIDGAGGRLTASNGLTLGPGFATLAFDPSEEAGLDFPGATVRTDLPGFDVTGVDAGATLQLEVLSRPDHSQASRPPRWLWYWDPATELIADAANDPDFQFRRKDLLGSVSFDQYSGASQTVLTVTESLTPDSHQHYLRYELDNSPAAASGLYGVFVRVLSPGFEPSAPFLMAFAYGVNTEQYAAGANAMNAAAGLAGDFDVDGDVDGGDLLAWQRTLGASGNAGSYPAADGSLDGTVNSGDLAIWRAEFGRLVAYPPMTQPAGAWAPEPGSGVLAAVAIVAWRAAQRRSKQRAGRCC